MSTLDLADLHATDGASSAAVPSLEIPPGAAREPLSPYRHMLLLRQLAENSARRVKLEMALAEALDREAIGPIQTARQKLQLDHEAASSETAQSNEQQIDAISERCERALGDAERTRRESLQEVTAQFTQDEAAAKKRLDDGRWECNAMLDAARQAVEGQLQTHLQSLTDLANLLGDIKQDAERMRRDLQMPAQEPLAVELPRDDNPLGRFDQCAQAANALRTQAADYGKHPLMQMLWVLPAAAALWALLLLVVGVGLKVNLFQAAALPYIVGAGVAAFTLAVLLGLMLVVLRKRQMAGAVRHLGEAIQVAEAARERCQEAVESIRQKHLATAQSNFAAEITRLENHVQSRLEQIQNQKDLQLRDIEREYTDRLTYGRSQRDASLVREQRQRESDLRQLEERFAASLQELDRRQQEAETALSAERIALAKELDEFFRETNDALRNDVVEIVQAGAARFPTWRSDIWKRWEFPTTVPGGIRFGDYDVNVREIPYGIPADERHRRTMLKEFTLPATSAFPSCPSLLYKAHGDGRAAAVASLQSVMLRLLTALPAGKVRFTIIDPVGLGENFAGFMHLADYEEALVNSRIWTEAEHIDRRLADLTEHLENVIQTYLRNEFDSIEAYNRDAGEVAEPFRFLIVANFPTNFTESAVKRLISIASSGARCGVYVMVIVDTKQKLPPNCSLRDLEEHCNVLKWECEKFVWQHPELGKYPLRLDAPPPPEVFSEIVHTVGRAAKDAQRVRVPFRQIVPTGSECWTGDCSQELSAPLGKVGATKFQHLRLGRGTSQHVVVAGKTGSGKSTLLHVLISSLALRYSPDELQFYLIDFKKGVEFKVYATNQLPHARVVAVESEREFGLSVLQRLDMELKLRGEAFRNSSAQELAGYREATGQKLPRILLVVDEFQELFVEDDRTSQDAALLLDRLVRQGRAFGIHVLLGSQTLGGAYSLARSTLGQMAVRIALECSESDASLILSEGNTAARLLSRPGEAIYNDANGRVEGNKPFQVAWLPDEEREIYLQQVQDLAAANKFVAAEPQIVFEGNIPADPAKNARLQACLNADRWPAEVKAAQAWLGEAVAIKDPTTATFRRQGGSNLLLVGQRDEGALAILCMSWISLAAQHSPGSSVESRVPKESSAESREPPAPGSRPSTLDSRLPRGTPAKF